MKSRRAGSVNKSLFRRRELVGAIGGGLLSFFFRVAPFSAGADNVYTLRQRDAGSSLSVEWSMLFYFLKGSKKTGPYYLGTIPSQRAGPLI